MAAPLLELRGLSVEFTSEGRPSRAVDGLDFEVHPGEAVGLVGETGCGKSATALSVLRLIPSPPGRIVGGQVLFEGADLLRVPPSELRRVRGAGIAMIFQEPMTSLDPSFTVGNQLGEVLRTHRGLRRAAARGEALRLLERVRMPHPERVLRQYPFELSGGMRQRVMIAMALGCRPRLVIADEPTTALDVTVEAQILGLLEDLRADLSTAVWLISHDLAVVRQHCDRAAVMYAGRIVESAPADLLFRQPLHPYTRALTQVVSGEGESRLPVIPGEVPSGIPSSPGCRFAPRCAHAMPRCLTLQPALRGTPDHQVACFLYEP